MAYYNNDNTPGAGFVGGFFQGLNQAFNKHMDRKYEQELRDRANIQHTIQSIDIPESISMNHRAMMANKLNEFRQEIVKLTMEKPKGIKGFLSNIYTPEDLLAIQGKANALAKEFYTLTRDDRQVMEEMKTWQNNRDLYDYDEMRDRLNVFNEKGILPGGTILSKRAMGIQDLFNAAYEDRRKALGTAGIPKNQVVKGSQKISTFTWGTDSDRFNFYAGAIQDESVAKGLARHMGLVASPEDVVKYVQGKISPEEAEKLFALMTVAKATGRTRELENNPVYQNIAKQWGADNVAPLLLQDTQKIDFIDPADIGDRNRTTENERIKQQGYKHYDSATLLDGTKGQMDVFNEPITTTIRGAVLDMNGKEIPYDGEEVTLIQRGNGMAFGEMSKLSEINEETYTKLGGKINKNLEVDDVAGKYYKKEKIKVKTPEHNVKNEVENAMPSLKLLDRPQEAAKPPQEKPKGKIPGNLSFPKRYTKAEEEAIKAHMAKNKISREEAEADYEEYKKK